MEWSPQQAQAIALVDRWLTGDSDQQVYNLHGCAGTGKTSLALELAKRAGKVVFAAYTGKAASVMQSKGCAGAQTIHSLIYKPVGDASEAAKEIHHAIASAVHELTQEILNGHQDSPEEVRKRAVDAAVAKDPHITKMKSELRELSEKHSGPRFMLNVESALNDADLLVLDEVSMVGAETAADLLSFGVKILALGDPAQLPPVKDTGYFIKGKPDYMLTEIHRQAKGNPIIQLATDVREGRGLRHGEYGESRVIPWSALNADIVLKADQVLCGTNKRRIATNARIRELLGRTRPTPEAGDKIICLRNDRDGGLLNGTMYDVEGCSEPFQNRVQIDIKSRDSGAKQTVAAHSHYFLGGSPPMWEIKEAQCFDYGNCITAHKSQGSQWDTVLVLDESFCFREDAKKWLYTAITRAAKRVIVVRD